MKEKGFTLIELVVVLSILSCIVSTTVLSYRFIKNIEDKQNIESSIRNIDDTITFARLYCLKSNKRGRVLIDKERREYSFYQDWTGYAKPIRKEKLKGNINFDSIRESNGWEIRINNFGIPSAGTLYLIDDKNKKYSIAIGVGNSNEEIH